MPHRARDGGLMYQAQSAASQSMPSLTEADPGSPLASGEGNGRTPPRVPHRAWDGGMGLWGDCRRTLRAIGSREDG